MFVTVARSPLHGRGCFSTQAVAAGEVVARVPLLIFPPEQTEMLFRTEAKNYAFYLKDGDTPEGPYFTALAMGPVSFCNHSDQPNCDFSLDEAAAEITLVARRGIEANEEITIDYGDYAQEIL